MQAKFPGQYIHQIIFEIPVDADGHAILFIGVDNKSRYCFSHIEQSPFTVGKLIKHINKTTEDLRKSNITLTPTFIMAYGEELKSELEEYYREKVIFLFDQKLAEDIALPVASKMFQDIGQNR